MWEKSTGIFTALLMGLVASVSTCLALTGGIVLSFSSEYAMEEKASFWKRALPQCSFHTGRLVGFSILGGILGAMGGAIQYSPAITGVLTIIVAMIMLTVGLYILGFIPNITRFGIHLPKAISRPIARLQRKTSASSRDYWRAYVFLTLWFYAIDATCCRTFGQFCDRCSHYVLFRTRNASRTFSLLGLDLLGHNKKLWIFSKNCGTLILFFTHFTPIGTCFSRFKITIDFWNFSPSQHAIPLPETTSETKENEQVVTMDIDYTFQQTEFRVKKGSSCAMGN